MSEEEESKRVSVQVSSLSTQLIESIDKQSLLEEQLLAARKVINGQKASLEALEDLKAQLSQTRNELKAEKAQNAKNRGLLRTAEEEKGSAQAEADRLNKEVEELTASLFDEANSMVADARRETHNFKVKNDKLSEQLQEKDTLLETLKIQLKNLKGVLYNLEQEQCAAQASNRNSVVANESGALSSGPLEKTMNALTGTLPTSDTVVFSPYLKSLRYDLGLYNEFLKFVTVLPECSSIKDTTSRSKLLRRLVNDEIQPMLRLDNASGVGWYVRRNLMNLMMEGMVIIEPVSGINETYRLGHGSNSAVNSPQLPKSEKSRESHLYNYPADSPPVAIQDPCAFCSESRNDILEHGRLYLLKTLQKNEDGSITPNAQFPLCHYCLLKIRQTCEIFAFLRLLKSGAWHLEDLSEYHRQQIATDGSAPSANASENPGLENKSKRATFMAGLSKSLPSKVPSSTKMVPLISSQSGNPSTNTQRAWAQLCKLRASLHWAHIGIWALEDSLETKIGPVATESRELSESTILTPDYLKKRETRDSFTIHKSESTPTDEDFDFEMPDNGKFDDTGKVSTDKSTTSEPHGDGASLSQKHDNENLAEALENADLGTQRHSSPANAGQTSLDAERQELDEEQDTIEPVLKAVQNKDALLSEFVEENHSPVKSNATEPRSSSETQLSDKVPSLMAGPTSENAKLENSVPDNKIQSTTDDEDAAFDDAHSTVP
ncbi:LAFA_0G02278g1_1 [Lachancea sp. 'fantastica']|nr:LAFA_0G02278g1_1 [Lachancea sp. 'fantastica']